MPHAVDSFLKIYTFVEELMLVLQVFHNSAEEDVSHCVPPRSESSLIFSQQFLGLTC
ncbi:hypothetical protein DPMN_143065 [Dreissena polymorpha]|uniref:Uncharacterized protein n=1 Tax=Dreissena polymorpha TaxID=45954 RepID=A0A9D4JMT6_DREPO|nr:hypothetical protein DPMN_143065 [Dreissena polymorpha]